jgi:hypothetical protein
MKRALPLLASALLQPEHNHLLPYDLYTVPISSVDNNLPLYGEELLSERGKAELAEAKDGPMKGIFKSWSFDRTSSGSWFPDPSLPVPGREFVFMNTLSNRRVTGRLEGVNYSDPRMVTETSIVVWVGDGWCSTTSGSVYGIPPENHSGEIVDYLRLSNLPT